MSPFDRTALYGALLLVIAALFTSGCATDPAVAAQQGVTTAFTAIGAIAVIARPGLQQCEAKALADKNQAEMDKCAHAQGIMAKVFPTALDTAHSVPAGITAYAALKAKNYDALLAPLYGFIAELTRALTDAGVQLPYSLPGVN